MSFFPLSLSFVSLLVGKEKGADLTFCPWYYKLMVDPLSFFEIPEDIVLQVKIKHPK